MYEDYMQNLLGENFYQYQNTYEQTPRDCGYCTQMDDYYNIPQNYYSRNSFMPSSNMDLENLYPEIYKIVYPMVKKACSKISRIVDEDLIEDMTKEIYENLETGNIININVSVDDNNVNSNNRNSVSSQPNSNIKREKTATVENRSSESRQFNPIRDLIRILLIRELIGRPNPRPPYPGPRPPMPPSPSMPGQRPPMPPPPHRPRF